MPGLVKIKLFFNETFLLHRVLIKCSAQVYIKPSCQDEISCQKRIKFWSNFLCHQNF